MGTLAPPPCWLGGEGLSAAHDSQVVLNLVSHVVATNSEDAPNRIEPPLPGKGPTRASHAPIVRVR